MSTTHVRRRAPCVYTVADHIRRSKFWDTAKYNTCSADTMCKRGRTSIVMSPLLTHGGKLKECTVFDVSRSSPGNVFHCGRDTEMWCHFTRTEPRNGTRALRFIYCFIRCKWLMFGRALHQSQTLLAETRAEGSSIATLIQGDSTDRKRFSEANWNPMKVIQKSSVVNAKERRQTRPLGQFKW